MRFPPWDAPEPTEQQLLQIMHADTRQLYETGEMTLAQRQQLQDGVVAEWKALQKARSNLVQTVYDTYTVTKQIGQGGNGFVYQVINSSGEKLALKLLDPKTATEDKRKRFKNELGFCERNQHKNIITVLDHGLVENVPFYIMPCCSGSLRDVMRSDIKPERVLQIFAEILDGVEAAHLQKVIHRDLKPENILFDDSSLTPIIADFGIAHFEEEDLITAVETRDGFKLANFQYAAPEQRMRRQTVDHRADIYALGLILNEMFTGTLALGTNHKTIASVAPQYSYLDELVSLMLCSNPADRPQTIEAVKRQIRAREQEYFAQQQLSESLQKVIPVTDLDDPLIIDPPKLVDWDWIPNRLTLILSKSVTERWVFAFQQTGTITTTWRPDNFKFQGNLATVSVVESDVQRAINYFKDCLAEGNSKYEELLRIERAQEEAVKRRNVQKEIEANEARARLRKSIKL